ncbi:MAG: T9SS type A sorting domain-containing protein [Saprospiraceae bacterium]|nr:T9SS type A sorting domain-containing protein [Saprospiraceae bacterium]
MRINTQGEKLLKNNQNIEEVNFEKFPVGIYFAIITVDNGKTMTYKIIKQ